MTTPMGALETGTDDIIRLFWGVEIDVLKEREREREKERVHVNFSLSVAVGPKFHVVTAFPVCLGPGSDGFSWSLCPCVFVFMHSLATLLCMCLGVLVPIKTLGLESSVSFSEKNGKAVSVNLIAFP